MEWSNDARALGSERAFLVGLGGFYIVFALGSPLLPDIEATPIACERWSTVDSQHPASIARPQEPVSDTAV